MASGLRAPITILSTVYAGYFGAVMATGIVSLALHLAGSEALSTALMWAAAGIWFVLTSAYVVRAILRADPMTRDLSDPETMFAFFTVTAGSNVLATRLALAGVSFLPLMLGGIGV